ncbi:hypothetical protein [Aequorivita viscosa]|uniref:Cell wall anchor protein n=1 Tax=Aequorivita viscosa TaxID=797419 RepID=A0A1M6KQR4_9FLAO|nr:hypothetical protein [Aequorivita viscosa]SDX03215.1 hypothetical protein SAMN05216556_11514 [Aequorivita viscosa]SHJ61224.1 hypothetical protein SAMN04487908_1219 [Aequorivita viscosa]
MNFSKFSNLQKPFHRQLVYVWLLLVSVSINAQVGIGTTDPQPSSILEIKSNSQGLLVPRMTTAERTAIVDAANSLLVYDTDLKTYFYYDDAPSNSKWIKISSEFQKRNNFKLVKSVADLAPELASGGGSKYLLDTNTFYEINGTINLAFPIDLNNAYISGVNTNKDILVRTSGNVFTGTNGGSIKNLTITGGGTVFQITGGTTLIVQNTIISNMASVGTISNVWMYFGNIIQYLNNNAGITYSNISNLLLSNQGWFDSNKGTYEKFTGTFGLIEKVSGFSTANGSAVAMDFSSNPTVSNGVILNVAFSGTSTQYVKGYAPAPYVGYNFTNKWTVNCPGIPHESDGVATGDIVLDLGVGSSVSTTFTGTGASSRKKLSGTTISNNLLRFEKSGDNKIIYRGSKKRYFQVNASLSFQSTTNNATIYIFYIAKGSGSGAASVVLDSKVYGRTASSTTYSSVPIVATIELGKDDYIEVWAERYSGSAQMNVHSLSLSAQ